MMFQRSPPLITPTLTTTGLRASTMRLEMVCSAVITWAEATTGSTPPQGNAACVCLPMISTLNWSTLANMPPIA